jgi:integral membrane protein (TIGR01906 family)
MKIIRTIIFIIFIFSLPSLLIIGTLSAAVNEIRLYEYNINKYDISEITGLEKEELRDVFQHLIDFYNYKVGSAQIEVTRGEDTFTMFNEKELLHLEDIKNLLQLGYRVQLTLVALLVISGILLVALSKERWRLLLRALFWGSIITLSLIFILVIWTVIDFNRLFWLFHEVSFANEFWLLNPNTDYLKMIFPDAFFFDAVVFILGAIIIESLLIGGISFGINRVKFR